MCYMSRNKQSFGANVLDQTLDTHPLRHPCEGGDPAKPLIVLILEVILILVLMLVMILILY